MWEVMNTIFAFTNKKDIYNKCLYASIAHAVMVGNYPLLSEEIAWDGSNYLFQNMEGVRGVIAFSNDFFMCGVQNQEKYEKGVNEIVHKLLDTAKEEIVKFAEEEIFPYFLIESENNDILALSTLFWLEDDLIVSCMIEEDVMKDSDNTLLPYLYEFDDLKKYWQDYYEHSDEQLNFIGDLYQKRLVCEEFQLDFADKEKLVKWFGNNVKYCEQSLREIGIKFA